MWVARAVVEAGVPDTCGPIRTPVLPCSRSMPIRDAIRRAVPSGPSSPHDAADTPFARLLSVARSRERELWFVVVAAMLVDVTLTVHGLSIGLTEANPIARAAIDSAGVLGLYGLKAGALAVGGCCRLVVRDRYGFVVPVGLGLPSAAAVLINSAIIGMVVVL